MIKIVKGLIGTIIIALFTTVILNYVGVKINAKEIEHEKEVRELNDATLKDSLDKQTKHLENIEKHLRAMSRGNQKCN